jgi:hypothetical protein
MAWAWTPVASMTPLIVLSDPISCRRIISSINPLIFETLRRDNCFSTSRIRFETPVERMASVLVVFDVSAHHFPSLLLV